MRSKPKQFSLAQAADMAGIAESLLILWIGTKHFSPSIELESKRPATGEDLLGWNRFILTEEDVERLRKLVENAAKKPPFIDEGQEIFTVAQVASLWHLSEDTIRRLFEDELGVLSKGDRNPRGKRRRVTLRIPRAVMERVRRKLANK
jgi:hypothetical protein